MVTLTSTLSSTLTSTLKSILRLLPSADEQIDLNSFITGNNSGINSAICDGDCVGKNIVRIFITVPILLAFIVLLLICVCFSQVLRSTLACLRLCTRASAYLLYTCASVPYICAVVPPYTSVHASVLHLLCSSIACPHMHAWAYMHGQASRNRCADELIEAKRELAIELIEKKKALRNANIEL